MRCRNLAILIYMASLFCFSAADATEKTEPLNVCYPNPCGEHGKCTVVSGGPSCTCDDSKDTPDSRCRPECTKDDDCLSDKACIKYACKNPCPGDCGASDTCQVDDHKPYCNPPPVVSICVTNPRACT